MKIHILDVGRTKYGDCIIITHNEKVIMIDGGHLSDVNLIQFQLDNIFNRRTGIAVDLLIVTHCHSDHIGCLPELINMNIIEVGKALVADEEIGWGESKDTGNDSFSKVRQGLRFALQEEDAASFTDSELELFLYDAFTLRQRYDEMLKKIGDARIIRYGNHSAEDLEKLLEEFSDFGLKILGPDKEHLEICRKAISQSNDAFDSIINDSKLESDAFEDAVDVYRTILKQVETDNFDVSDKASTGAPRNNQSIVLSLEAEGWKALLTGDMQLAKSQVQGLDEKMEALLKIIDNNGPYQFIKLPHHSASNGINETILKKWNENTILFGHTGGWNDPAHPDGGVLRILEKYKNSLLFARTDRNGMYIVEKDESGVAFLLTRDNTNDFSKNIRTDTTVPGPLPSSPAAVPASVLPEKEISKPPLNYAKQMQDDDSVVEITAKVPHTDTKVTLTIEIDTSKKKSPDLISTTPPDKRSSNGGRFEGLLFVTCLSRLEKSLGTSPDPIVSVIKNFPGVYWLNIERPVSAAYCAEQVRQYTSQSTIKGVVIIGGYDIIPAERAAFLDEQLREDLITEGTQSDDNDDFIIWSDDIYGDNDNDALQELPVSRIPDGRSIELVMVCLQAPQFVPVSRFGVRNLARPFANDVFKDIPGGDSAIEVSETFGPSNVIGHSGCGSFYYMLHGADWDCTRFWGEAKNRRTVEAYTIENVPSSAPGSIIFAGCCYGALTVSTAASKMTEDTTLSQWKPDESIALAFLKAGALAFVGCTGEHYSPQQSPYNYYGKPMHDQFWKEIRNGSSPALALFKAKEQYARNLPHKLDQHFNAAVELKILHQFVCLGLGW
ncbi:MBL fold metallo-hydrolase [Mucilaginibacter ginsenosidivorax]|uniref:MBL fold metallo-hydrolase n=1 Tax=Mucilaginibacter ginsenosidivorax TaxID=862126 RepID=A0A5B8W478_9SPHI|nr:MBL fold metallo-hydrolase [Mucilaginibacter ginsenosidivorax]QEC78611.1 MBL fold metallo-hydrolase [Mucilaginibacter ginsenosidivorax]